MTSSQKKTYLIGLLALLPAYFFATWRYEVNHSAVETVVQREEQIRQSDLKLLAVCKETGLDQSNSFDSTAVLCKQAQERYTLQERLFTKLEEDKKNLQHDVYWNLLWVWLLVNGVVQMLMRWAAIKQKLGD